jgi:DNA invertase Pin-like site-specific DNA recombinase
MKKVILFIRVSTVAQDYTAQKSELVQYAKSFGYAEDEMHIIAGKESATKLDDEERQTLNELWDYLNENQHIECVFAWELSRISRKPKTLFDIKDKLIARKVNLRTKTEGVNLFRDGKEDTSANIAFAVFSAMTESEGRIRLQRFKRAKDDMKAKGLYIGGRQKFGYRVNKETKRYEVFEEEAAVIRKCFELYSTGKFGLEKLHKELQSRKIYISAYNLFKLFNFSAYTGESNILYPAIVSVELYNKCREVANNNNTTSDKAKTIYYAHGLIKCTCCNSNLIAQKFINAYQCKTRYRYEGKKKCSGSENININYIDSLLWHLAMQKEAEFVVNQSTEQTNEYNEQIDELNNKLLNSESVYQTLFMKQRIKIKKMFNNKTDKEIDSLTADSLIEERHQIEIQRVSYKSEVSRLNNLINAQNEIVIEDFNNEEFKAIDAKDKKYYYINRFLIDINDDNVIYDIVHKHIKEVRIEKDATTRKKIIVKYFAGNDEIFYYDYKLKETYMIHTLKESFEEMLVNIENLDDDEKADLNKLYYRPVVFDMKYRIKSKH